MQSVYDSLYNWARKTTTSFGELRDAISPQEKAVSASDGLIYRLKSWPDLSASNRTAAVYRTLSMMSHRPVNRQWLLKHSKMRSHHIDRLLAGLVRDEAVEVIDAARFAVGSR